MTWDTTARIIDDRVKALYNQIQKSPLPDQENLLKKLVSTLDENCKNPLVRARYESYRTTTDSAWSLRTSTPYPTDSEGYAVSFDPLEDEEGFWNAWSTFGVVVGKSVVDDLLCKKTLGRLSEILTQMSDGTADLTRPETLANLPEDGDGTPCLSRGFFEIYHDDSLAQLRQAIRVYLHNVIIWGRADLWTTFDRYGVKFPQHADAKGLPLHVDQNPCVHPHFKTVQGVLALVDCPLERGTYVAVPGSKNIFPGYADLVQARGDNYVGEYVEALTTTEFGQALQPHAQPLPLRAGDMVSWDSRTTHANSSNLSDKTRFVAYISAGVAAEENQEAIEARLEAFKTGLGSNVREALMHASMRPRYTNETMVSQVRRPENLSYLGKLLYGKESYVTQA